MKTVSTRVTLSMAVAVSAAAALVGAQTLQRPKALNPRILATPAVPPTAPNSAMTLNLPDPQPEDPDWDGKHEPLTLHVAESPLAGRALLISVTKSDGSGFYKMGLPKVVQVYSPYYPLKRTDRIVDIDTFVFGNATVESKVRVSPKGHMFSLTLACQRSDPDIPANEFIAKRPFLVLVSWQDPQTKLVYRGETMVTLAGYVVEKP